jgi:hypothetical protein
MSHTRVPIHVRRAAIAALAVGLAALAAAVLVGPLTLTPPFVEDDTGGPVAVDAGPSAPERTFATSVERVESCGATCREVTATLVNRADRPREDVSVVTRLYADGDLLWETTERVGRLAAGETHTSTERVDLGYAGALAVESNDGYVTVERTVRADGEETTFAERRRVE